MNNSMSRGKLSRITGVNSETIRYYESRGLMPDPGRTIGGHRLYTKTHRKRLQFIHRCRELGFSLVDVEKLLSLSDISDNKCEEIQKVTSVQIATIKQKITDLRRMEKTLKTLDSECKTSKDPDCAFLDALFD